MEMPCTFFFIDILIDKFSAAVLCVLLNNAVGKHFFYISVKRTFAYFIRYLFILTNFFYCKLLITVAFKKINQNKSNERFIHTKSVRR